MGGVGVSWLCSWFRPSMGLVTIVLVGFVLVACASDGNISAADRVLADSGGDRIVLSDEIDRIVSLAPSGTEILFAIGVGGLVVGTDDFSNYPPEAAKIERVGSLTPDIERVISLAPDLVVAAFITSPDDIEKLRSAGISVWVADSVDVRGVSDAIRGLGAAVGRAQAADEVASSLDAHIDRVVGIIAQAETRPRVFYEIDASDPTKPFTVGPGNFVDDLLTLAGGENVFGDAPTPFLQVGLEDVLARDPDVIVLADAPFGTSAASVRARTGWDVLTAVKAGRMLEVSEELSDRMLRPGPRIGQALEALARFLHPDLFE